MQIKFDINPSAQCEAQPALIFVTQFDNGEQWVCAVIPMPAKFTCDHTLIFIGRDDLLIVESLS